MTTQQTAQDIAERLNTIEDALRGIRSELVMWEFRGWTETDGASFTRTMRGMIRSLDALVPPEKRRKD